MCYRAPSTRVADAAHSRGGGDDGEAPPHMVRTMLCRIDLLKRWKWIGTRVEDFNADWLVMNMDASEKMATATAEPAIVVCDNLIEFD